MEHNDNNAKYILFIEWIERLKVSFLKLYIYIMKKQIFIWSMFNLFHLGFLMNIFENAI